MAGLDDGRVRVGDRAPAREATPAAPVGELRQYELRAGDSLIRIAEAWFGDAQKWTLLAEMNPDLDPNKLQIGQKVLLPPKDATVPARLPKPLTAKSTMPGTRKVAKGVSSSNSGGTPRVAPLGSHASTKPPTTAPMPMHACRTGVCAICRFITF